MASHGTLEHIPRTDVKKLVHELQLHQIRLPMHRQELHRAKQSNSEARDRYADLYDLVPVGYFTLDLGGIIIEVNLTGAGLLRTEKNRFVNQPLHLWVIPNFQETWRTHFQQVFKTGVRQTCEIKLMPQSGPPFFAVLDSCMVPAKESQAPTFHTAMRDITARKQMESELKLKGTDLGWYRRLLLPV